MQPVQVGDLTIGDAYPPRIMGVLNVSPDSPYEPSVYEDPDAAAAYVESELIAEGADMVDVGLESANKRFAVRSVEWELDRLDLAVEAILQVEQDVVFSIETRYHEVAEEALSRGFDMVNDICGFADPEMPAVCEAHDAAVVKMASPPDLERPGALADVDEAYEALQREGLTAKTIVDPAFGGWSEDKTIEVDQEMFRRLREFQGLGCPLLVSINRKNFLRKPLGRSTEEALPASLAATSMAVERGVRVIRTHDVAETRDAALTGYRYARSRVQRDRVVELDVTTPNEAVRHLGRLGLDEDLAGESVTRVFLLRGLNSQAHERVVNAAQKMDVHVANEDAEVYLAGTVTALQTFTHHLARMDNNEVLEVASSLQAGL